MSDKRLTLEIHIVMTEDGEFVVDDDADAAAERAEENFPDDDVRQIILESRCNRRVKVQSRSRQPF